MREIKNFLQNKVIVFNNENCNAVISKYASGHTYMALTDEAGLPVARVSLSIESIPVIHGLIIIKDYAENKGVYDALLKAGVVKPCERKFAIGHEFAKVCFFDLPPQPTYRPADQLLI